MILSFKPDISKITQYATEANLGDLCEIDGIWYRYLQRDSNDTGTMVANLIMRTADSATDPNVVTMLNADGSRNMPRGISQAEVTAGYFFWGIQEGRVEELATNGDDDISAGDSIILGATDGTCDSVAAGTAVTYTKVGIARADDVDGSDTVDVYVKIP